MDAKTITARIRAAAAYVEETRAPAKEREIIERILGTAAALRRLADEIEQEEAEKAEQTVKEDTHAADNQ